MFTFTHTPQGLTCPYNRSGMVIGDDFIQFSFVWKFPFAIVLILIAVLYHDASWFRDSIFRKNFMVSWPNFCYVVDKSSSRRRRLRPSDQPGPAGAEPAEPRTVVVNDRSSPRAARIQAGPWSLDPIPQAITRSRLGEAAHSAEGQNPGRPCLLDGNCRCPRCSWEEWRRDGRKRPYVASQYYVGF
jgi:hypothetical protein